MTPTRAQKAIQHMTRAAELAKLHDGGIELAEKMNEAATTYASGQRIPALAFVFSILGPRLAAKRFDEINAMLARISPEKMPNGVVLAILMNVLPAWRDLPDATNFYDSCLDRGICPPASH